jgi:Domain of unknown function (DUF4263)
MDIAAAQALARRATTRWLDTSNVSPTRSLELALVRAASKYDHLTDLSLLSALLELIPQTAERFTLLHPAKLHRYLLSPSQQVISNRQAGSLSLTYLLQHWPSPEKLGIPEAPREYSPGEDYRIDPILEWKSSQPEWLLRKKLDDFLIGDLSQWLKIMTIYADRSPYTLRLTHPLFSYLRYASRTGTIKGEPKLLLIKEMKSVASALADLESITDSHESLLLIPAGNRLMVRPLSHLAHGLLEQDDSPPDESAVAASINAEVSPFGFSEAAILELEDLINSPLSKEADLQRYFGAYPQLLLGLDYSRLIPQPILRRDLEPDLIPDFILLPLESSSRGPKIVDLKLPGQGLVRRDTNRLGYLSAVHKARDQLLEYQRYFSGTAAIRESSVRWGHEIFMPEMCVVIGRSSSFSNSLERQRARASTPDLELLTYDDVVMTGRRLLDTYRNR